MILDHSSHKCDVWKLESIPTLVKWNLKPWKNCVSESQCSLSTSFYMVHDHHSWELMLGYTPNKSKSSSIVHVISCWPSQLLALRSPYISQSYNTQIKFAYKHENIKKQIHCKSSNNNNPSSNMYLQNWNKTHYIFMPIRCKLLNHPNFLHLFH
jgi:hypothetical protein